MKSMNSLKSYASRIQAGKIAAGTALMSLAISAQAALPDAVKTEVDAAKTDVTELAGLILGVWVVAFGYKMIKRFL